MTVDLFTYLHYNLLYEESMGANRMIDDILDKLISQLPASPTELDKANVKRFMSISRSQQTIKLGGLIFQVLVDIRLA